MRPMRRRTGPRPWTRRRAAARRTVEPRKVARYAATILELGDDDPLEIDLRRPAAELDSGAIRDAAGARAFTVITAENPGGRARAPDENARATAGLRRRLEGEGLRFVSAAGRDPDSDHREEGFAVAGALEPMLGLARRLDQDAVFRFDGERFLLIDARDGTTVSLPLNA